MTGPVEIYLNAVCAGLKARLPALGECSVHDGLLTESELKQFSVRAPAIKIAPLGFESPQGLSGGAMDWTVKMTAIIVTRDTPAISRGAAARAIVGQCLVTIAQNDWGLSHVHAASLPVGRNLYADNLDRSGTAFWRIDWDQGLRLAANAVDASLDPALYIGFAPRTGRDHIDEYRRAGMA